MGFYLYCIVPPRYEPPHGLRGVDDAEVRSFEGGPVNVWYSEMTAPPPPAIERIRAHDQVVRSALSEGVSPLPVRFGQWVPDPSALRLRLAESAEGYERTLALLAGCVEFGIRILDPHDRAEEIPEPPEGGGKGYLRALAERARVERARLEVGERIASALEGALGDLVRKVRPQPKGSAGCLLDVAHLVPEGRVALYLERVEEFRALHPESEFVLTGPWPPYSFDE